MCRGQCERSAAYETGALRLQGWLQYGAFSQGEGRVTKTTPQIWAVVSQRESLGVSRAQWSILVELMRRGIKVVCTEKAYVAAFAFSAAHSGILGWHCAVWLILLQMLLEARQ